MNSQLSSTPYQGAAATPTVTPVTTPAVSQAIPTPLQRPFTYQLFVRLWSQAQTTRISLSLSNAFMSVFGLIIACVFRTSQWIQSDVNQKSLNLAKWQTCISNPDNSVGLHLQ